MDQTPPSNPYSPPESPATGIAPTDQPVENPAVELPQPNIWWVLLIVFGFLIFQLGVGVVIGVICLAIHLAGKDVDPQNMAAEFNQALGQASSQELMIFGASASTCVFAFVLSLAVYGWLVGKRVAMRPCTAFQAVLVAMAFLPFAVVVSEIGNWLTPLLPSFGEQAMEQAMFGMSKMSLPMVVIAVCVFPAVGEELLFRGFIGRGLVGRYGVFVGVLVTSILFGAVHIHPLQSICAAILGVALHLIYLWTKSLLAPMLLHFLNNLFAMMCLRYNDVIPIPGVSIISEEGIIHTPVAITLSSIVIAAVLLRLLYQSRSTWRDKGGKQWPFGYVTAETPLDEQATLAARMPSLGAVLLLPVMYAGYLALLGWTIARHLPG